MFKKILLIGIVIFAFLIILGAISDATKKTGEKGNDPSAEVTQSDSRWKRYENNPIVFPGAVMDPFTNVSINAADPSVLYDAEEGIWKMWFANAFDQNNNYEKLRDPRVGISYATSRDGLEWTIDTHGVLMPTSMTGGEESDWDYTNIETPTVIKNPNPRAPASQKYMMWYAGGNSEEAKLKSTGHPYYQIGLAYSSDGKNFVRVSEEESPYNVAGLILKSVDTVPGYPKPETGVVADPHVLYRDGAYHMWFSNITFTNTRETMQTAGISYARSEDGITWSPHASNPLTSLWRENIAVGWQPSVVWNTTTNQYEMWYSADTDDEAKKLKCRTAGVTGYFKATSRDGIEWKTNYAEQDFRGDKSYEEEGCNLITGVDVVQKGGKYYMYYSSYGTKEFPKVLSDADYPWMWSISVSTQ